MYSKKILIFIFLCNAFFAKAQTNKLQFKDGTSEKRASFYNKVINSINKTIALPFTEQYDENWQSAFYNIGLVQYKTAAVNKKIEDASKILLSQSIDFQKAFVNLINSNYQSQYSGAVQLIFSSTTDSKLLAMAANYLLQKATLAEKKVMNGTVLDKLSTTPNNTILQELSKQIQSSISNIKIPSLKPFFTKEYLPKTLLVFSFQRKDRNYPGMAMVRDTNGNFVRTKAGKYFNIGQLARSNSNMPGYITNGNTPQGIFRITGFDTSSNYFIGPTPNLQLAMPHEYNRSELEEGNIIDTTWTLSSYANFLPLIFRKYEPMFGTFYAGKIGRTEIISHGTTIDAEYYKSTAYYPYTPTAGCLCTKEKWSSKTGFLEKSDQLLLYEAVKNAGNPIGYLIVIEIDDIKSEVSISDIEKYLPK